MEYLSRGDGGGICMLSEELPVISQVALGAHKDNGPLRRVVLQLRDPTAGTDSRQPRGTLWLSCRTCLTSSLPLTLQHSLSSGCH